MAAGASALLEPPEHPEGGTFGAVPRNVEFYEGAPREREARTTVSAAGAAKPANTWRERNRRSLFLRRAHESRVCGLLPSRGLVRHQPGRRVLYVPPRAARKRESVCHRT